MKSVSRQNTLAGLFLFLALFGVYSLSYSGVPAADDEQLFAAAAINAAENGVLSAEQLYGNSRLVGGIGGIEPLHSLAASWVLRSGVFNAAGRMQALFLINSLYTALTGLLLFGLVLQLEGTLKQALISAMLYGFGTLAWPYTKTFFREPLATLLLTLAVYLLVLATGERVDKRLRIAVSFSTVFCFGAALLTKVLLLAVLPALVVLVALRVERANDDQRNEIWRAGGIALIVVFCLLAIGWAVLGLRMPPRLTLEFFRLRYHNLITLPHDGFWLALTGIFLSSGKGLFFYMPVLLASMVGGFVFRRRNPTLFWFPMLAVLGLAVTQALVYDAGWWNMTWGTRFMLPVLPLMVLMGLPALQWLEENRNSGLKATVWGLFALSCVIQLGGVFIADPAYLVDLYEQALQPVPELVLWHLRYAPWLGHWRMVLQGALPDLALARIFQGGNRRVLAVWGVQALLVAGNLLAVWRMECKAAANRLCILAGVLSLAMLAVTGVNMRLYRQDPAWYSGREDFAAAEALVQAELADGDGVIVSPYLYPLWYHAMNEGQFGEGWYSWPLPGDEEAAEQAMEDFLSLAQGYERLWLIEEASVAGEAYPVEGQFGEHFELVGEWVLGDDVRVSVFDVHQ